MADLGMREYDKTIFSKAVQHFQVWILVRKTNEASLHYVGEPGYYPKPIQCKARTANNPADPRAGLVVDPVVAPEAFTSGKLASVERTWRDFAVKQGLVKLAGGVNRNKADKQTWLTALEFGQTPSGFSIDLGGNSRRYGCRKLHGNYLHGDYDLYDIVDPQDPRFQEGILDTRQGEKHVGTPRLAEIQQFINSQIGVPMVQHGGEAQYAEHSEQTLNVFQPPDGSYRELNGLGEILEYYEHSFKGRETMARLLHWEHTKATMH